MEKIISIFLSTLALTALCFAEVINVPGDYTTIQAAVNAADPGDTIQVDPGTYSGFSVTAKDDITLRGNGMFGPAKTTIMGTGVDVFSVNYCSGWSISGFEIINGERGILIYYSHDSEIYEIYAHNNMAAYGLGIDIHGCHDIECHHNLCTSNYYSGIYLIDSYNIRIINNTVAYNSGLPWGANGILFHTYTPGAEVINNIVVFNADEGIEAITYQGTIANYNDVYGNGGSNWLNITPQIGNISLNPLFTTVNDCPYALSSNSPCVDTGDPNILDPDGTRSDMGALYLDYFGGGGGSGSGILSLEVIPNSATLIVPPQGGSVEFEVIIQCENDYRIFDGWYDIILPDGQTISPFFQRQNIYLAQNGTIDRTLTISVPAMAQAGEYEVFVYVGLYPDSVDATDSFTFEKESYFDSGIGKSSTTWSISGWGETEYFDVPISATQPESYELTLNASPNPFNPETTLSFDLPQAGEISLKIYDLTGREIAVLCDGYALPGMKEFRWNANNLPSGIYFAQLETGKLSTVKRLLLMK